MVFGMDQSDCGAERLTRDRPAAASRAFAVRRRLVLAVYMIMLVAVELYPFRLRANPDRDSGGMLSGIHGFHLQINSRRDFAENILLFVPFGFLSARILSERRRATSVVFVAALSVLTLSGVLEIAQTRIVERISAASDVIANTLGGIGGCLLGLRGLSGVSFPSGRDIRDER